MKDEQHHHIIIIPFSKVKRGLKEENVIVRTIAMEAQHCGAHLIPPYIDEAL